MYSNDWKHGRNNDEMLINYLNNFRWWAAKIVIISQRCSYLFFRRRLFDMELEPQKYTFCQVFILKTKKKFKKYIVFDCCSNVGQISKKNQTQHFFSYDNCDYNMIISLTLKKIFSKFVFRYILLLKIIIISFNFLFHIQNFYSQSNFFFLIQKSAVFCKKKKQCHRKKFEIMYLMNKIFH